MVNSINDEDDVQVDITNRDEDFDELELEDEEKVGQTKLRVCAKNYQSVKKRSELSKTNHSVVELTSLMPNDDWKKSGR